MDFSLAPITIHQIIVFLNVAEHGGFAKASGYLNMTQSAVSKSVAKLEAELGLALFHRTTREIHLTEAGEILYHEWRQNIKSLHDSYIKAASVQASADQILRIGIMNTARPERYFWAIEERFQKACPEIHLELSSAYMTDLERDLAEGQYDLIMVPDFERFSLEELGLSWKWAACSHANVMMGKTHPLAGRKSLKMSDILYENYASLEQQQHNHRMDLAERMAPYHVKPILVPGYRNSYEIKYLFREQERALIFIDEFFDYPENPNLVLIPVIDQQNGVICAWNSNNMRPQIQKFLDVLTPVGSPDDPPADIPNGNE